MAFTIYIYKSLLEARIFGGRDAVDSQQIGNLCQWQVWDRSLGLAWATILILL